MKKEKLNQEEHNDERNPSRKKFERTEVTRGEKKGKGAEKKKEKRGKRKKKELGDGFEEEHRVLLKAQ